MLTEHEKELIIAAGAEGRAEAYEHACRECEDYYDKTKSAAIRATLQKLINHFNIMAIRATEEAKYYNK